MIAKIPTAATAPVASLAPQAAAARASLRVWLDAYRRALLVSDAYRQLKSMRDEDLSAVGLQRGDIPAAVHALLTGPQDPQR